MSVLFMSGAGWQESTIDGVVFAGTVYDATTKYTGNYSFKLDTGAGPNDRQIYKILNGALGQSYFFKCKARFANWPTTNSHVFSIWGNGSATAFASLLISTTGTAQLYNMPAATTVGPTAQLTLNTWHTIEMECMIAAAGDDTLGWRLDGTEITRSTTQVVHTTAPDLISMFLSGAEFGTNKVMNIADIVVVTNDGVGLSAYPGNLRVALLLPTSDNARDTLWTGGTGGITNLWMAVDNAAPLGTAAETNVTQIEHAGGAAGTTDRYDANMTTYTVAGLVAGDTVKAVQLVAAHGEDISTGAKLLNFEVLSNPAIASSGDVNAGTVALGTYPTGWNIHWGTMSHDPSVTLGTAPVMRARRPETASRVASVCAMGLLVGYEPAAVAVDIPTKSTVVNQAVNRAATF